ncbi:MAG: peptidase M41, partial [Bacteroidia bacterium]|nr:peptidase M41 [Bacteroidia bacterium]
GQDYVFNKPYSEKTAEIVDEEVKKLIDLAYERTKNLLLENKAKLDALAKRLLEKEVLFKEDLEEIFGKRPFDEPAIIENTSAPSSDPVKQNGAPVIAVKENNPESEEKK